MRRAKPLSTVVNAGLASEVTIADQPSLPRFTALLRTQGYRLGFTRMVSELLIGSFLPEGMTNALARAVPPDRRQACLDHLLTQGDV